MTDKEKRELKDGVISIFKRFNILDHTATIGGLRDDILRCINSLQEEPVSEDLEEAAKNHAVERYRTTRDMALAEKCKWSFKAGAKWKDDQLGKLCYAASNKRTDEEAEIERDFVDGIIKKELSKAEKFIQDYTRNCSNIEYTQGVYEPAYQPWLTPDQARRAVEIAREEMLNDICEWIEENIGEYCDGEHIMFSAIHIENIDVFGQERFINDLKQAMKDE